MLKYDQRSFSKLYGGDTNNVLHFSVLIYVNVLGVV